MTKSVSTYVADLLYENEVVILPGLGGFVSSYKPANIDHVQGLLYPPSKNIAFNDNLLINDGLLINKIRSSENCTLSEAQSRLDTFIDELQTGLKSKEIIVIPEVGRLYLDFEQNMQFLPDSVNYNTDVYGLPTVQYYPILRSREAAIHDAVQPDIIIEPKSKRYKRRKSFTALLRPAVPFIFAGLVIVSGFLLYNWIKGADTSSLGKLTPISLPGNLNQSPSKTSQPYIAEELKLDEDDIDKEQTIVSEESDVEELDTDWINEAKAAEAAREKALLEANKNARSTDDEVIRQFKGEKSATIIPNHAIVVVHSFGDKANVLRMKERIEKAKYEPFTMEVNGLTKVGMKVYFDNYDELDTAFATIKDKYNERAYIYKKHMN